MFNLHEVGVQRRETYTIVILGGGKENVCEAPLLSVSMRSYGQNKTIYILFVSLCMGPLRSTWSLMASLHGSIITKPVNLSVDCHRPHKRLIIYYSTASIKNNPHIFVHTAKTQELFLKLKLCAMQKHEGCCIVRKRRK